MVRVGRVAQPEENGDDHDDQKRRSVREGRDPVVEPEHHFSFLDDSGQGAYGHDETEHEDHRGAQRG